jgi:hypothetical protein
LWITTVTFYYALWAVLLAEGTIEKHTWSLTYCFITSLNVESKRRWSFRTWSRLSTNVTSQITLNGTT